MTGRIPPTSSRADRQARSRAGVAPGFGRSSRRATRGRVSPTRFSNRRPDDRPSSRHATRSRYQPPPVPAVASLPAAQSAGTRRVLGVLEPGQPLPRRRPAGSPRPVPLARNASPEELRPCRGPGRRSRACGARRANRRPHVDGRLVRLPGLPLDRRGPRARYRRGPAVAPAAARRPFHVKPQAGDNPGDNTGRTRHAPESIPRQLELSPELSPAPNARNPLSRKACRELSPESPGPTTSTSFIEEGLSQ